MDNGHLRAFNLIYSCVYTRTKDNFDQFRRAAECANSTLTDRINEEIHFSTDSAVLRERVDNNRVYSSQYCRDRLKLDKDNLHFGHSDYLNKRPRAVSDPQSPIFCDRCKRLNCNWNLIDVMMKNKSGGDDAHTVAMETDLNGSSCIEAPNGNSRLMSNESVSDHLKGMSLSDRRASVTPRITLTNVEDEPAQKGNSYHQLNDEAMITEEDQCSSPLTPNFLAVPKLEELGPERRPPQMVKTM